MATHGITYQPVQRITIKAAEDLSAFRFVSHMGSLCAEDTKALGVVDQDWLDGELASIITLGTVPIETVTSVNIGDEIIANTDGKAITNVDSSDINGRALTATTGAGFIKIILIP